MEVPATEVPAEGAGAAEATATAAAEIPGGLIASAPGPSASSELPVAEGEPAGAEDDDDDDDDEEGPPRKKRGGHGRRKIEIEYIEDKIRRHITFSKRKAGISKKAYELSRLTGAQVLLLISSERGQIYSFATPKLQPILVNENSKQLIEQCLNAPDPMALPPAPMPALPETAAQMPPQPPPQAPPAAVQQPAVQHPGMPAMHVAPHVGMAPREIPGVSGLVSMPAATYLVDGQMAHGMMPQ
jgi:hypothetical protein